MRETSQPEQGVRAPDPAEQPYADSPVLLETLVAGKHGLGAGYRFDVDTLEVRANHLGIRGVFARRAMAKGAEIVSVPITNGSLTPFRAYEAAGGLIEKLGDGRFNISESFAIACAMYDRIANSSDPENDLLITASDMKASYSGSPMTCHGSLARAELLSGNNRAEFDAARALDEHIERLEVDAELFRALLAYVTSRYWKGAGVIPVLDWFNASYSQNINCEFRSGDGRFAYHATRRIEPGEEIVWNYNDATAVATWFSYGYVDMERPTVANLEVLLEDDQRERLEAFAERQLSYPRQKINPAWKIDRCLFQSKLLCPGDQAGFAEANRAVGNAVNSFINARTWFRTLTLSARSSPETKITSAELQADEPAHGFGIEREVISAMRRALANGLAQTRIRGTQFGLTAIGRNIDLAPYIEMAETANARWDETLQLLEKFCSAAELGDSLGILARRFAPGAESAEQVLAALAEKEAERRSLIATLAERYLKARLHHERQFAERRSRGIPAT